MDHSKKVDMLVLNILTASAFDSFSLFPNGNKNPAVLSFEPKPYVSTLSDNVFNIPCLIYRETTFSALNQAFYEHTY